MESYSGKNVVVTGAAHGIGTAFARYFAERGSWLVLVDIDGDALEKVGRTLPQQGREHLCLVKDLSVHTERQSLFDTLQAQNIDVDVLVNNAGIGYWSNLVDTPWERIEKVIDLNVKGTTHMVWLFLPQMLKRDRGIIINLSSTGAFCGANKAAAYTGTKAYVSNFTEAVDMEVYHTGVRTLTAHPGATDTNFWKANGTDQSAMYQKLKLMSSEETVADFMNALHQKKKSIIAGRRNRMMVSASRFIPRETLKRMAIRKYADVTA